MLIGESFICKYSGVRGIEGSRLFWKSIEAYMTGVDRIHMKRASIVKRNQLWMKNILKNKS